MSAFAQSSIGSWMPSFLIRSHGMSLAHVGLTLGLLTGIGAGLGAWVGGGQGSRFSGNALQGMIWAPVAATILCASLYIAAVLMRDGNTALWMLALPIFLGALWTAPSIALTQSLSPVNLRARKPGLHRRRQSPRGFDATTGYRRTQRLVREPGRRQRRNRTAQRDDGPDRAPAVGRAALGGRCPHPRPAGPRLTRRRLSNGSDRGQRRSNAAGQP